MATTKITANVLAPSSAQTNINSGSSFNVTVPTTFTTTTTVDGNLVVDTNVLFVDAVNNRVGVGTATPSNALHIIDSLRVDNGKTSGALNFGADVQDTVRTSNKRKLAAIVAPDYANIRNIEFLTSDSSTSTSNFVYVGGRTSGSNFAATSIFFVTSPSVSTTGGIAAMTINSSQDVGVGTTTPNEKLTISGNLSASGIAYAGGNKLAAETFAIAMAIAVG